VGRRPSCRALVLFANLSPVVLKFRTPRHDWADDVRSQPIDCGHHIAEADTYTQRAIPGPEASHDSGTFRL
jgi:hypothetical protein